MFFWPHDEIYLQFRYSSYTLNEWKIQAQQFNAELQTKLDDKLSFIKDDVLDILAEAVPEFREIT